jgi:hypothetical protein
MAGNMIWKEAWRKLILTPLERKENSGLKGEQEKEKKREER